MDYYELRKLVSKVVPRTTYIMDEDTNKRSKEKGRKSNYSEFRLDENNWVKKERLLSTDEINSFVEVSCRAAACPMPLNIDVWDGLHCPFRCRYCFADSFRNSLFNSFFDNAKSIGIRHCNPEKYKEELDKLMKYRGKDPHKITNPVSKAISLEMPLRFGIRYEDFIKQEERLGISLEMLNYLADNAYPVMVNTKSALIGTEPYVKALSRNKGKAAVHVTLISSNNSILKKLEPGAPCYENRLWAMEQLVKAGVRVVARIEPFMVFVNDAKEDVEKYIIDMKKIGVKHITFDTYSYTAKNPSIWQDFKNMGLDWDRIVLVGCDSQGLGSLLLGSFMEMFQKQGFKCSTFDMGNAPINNQDICCEVGDWFGKGFNWGCTVMASRLIIQRGNTPTTWQDFVEIVNKNGGFLSEALKDECHHLWNSQGNDAYSPSWSQGLTPVGNDGDIIWTYKKDNDFRKDILERVTDER